MQAPKDKLVEQNRRWNLEDLAVVQLVPAAVLGPSLQIRVAHALLRSLHARHFTIVVYASGMPLEIIGENKNRDENVAVAATVAAARSAGTANVSVLMKRCARR